MLSVQFSKARAEELLAAINSGAAIRPAASKAWTQYDMLSVAGLMFFAAMSHGPAFHADASKLHNEQAEFVQDQFFQDLHAAIEFYGNLTMQVADKEFDDNYESEVKAIIRTTGPTEMQIVPVEGFRKS